MEKQPVPSDHAHKQVHHIRDQSSTLSPLPPLRRDLRVTDLHTPDRVYRPDRHPSHALSYRLTLYAV